MYFRKIFHLLFETIQTRPEISERLVSLHCLRGIAALMVLLSHWGDFSGFFKHLRLGSIPVQLNDVSWLAIGMNRLYAALDATWLFAIEFGSGGVLIFFLISGFVIPLSAEKLSLASFAVRRIFRLYPALWFAVALIVGLSGLASIMGLSPYGYPAELIARSATLSGGELIDPVLWTLMIEIKFYTLVGIAVLIAGTLTLRTILVAAALTFAVAVPAFVNPELLHGEGLTNIWRRLVYATPFLSFMLIGTTISKYYFGQARLFPALLLVAALYMLYATNVILVPEDRASVDHGWRALAIFVAALLVEKHLLSAGATRIGRVFVRMLHWLGDISYPVYLLHGVAGGLLIAILMAAGFGLNMAMAMAFPALLATCWLAHRFVEIPGQRLGARAARTADEWIVVGVR